jgi:hypothetical protein
MKLETDMFDGHDTLVHLYKQREALNKKIIAQAHSVFLESSKKLFEIFPKLKAFRWHQYTPYFNDGEPCYFGVYYDYPEIKWDTCLDFKSDWEISDDSYSEVSEVFDSITNFLMLFHEEDLEQMFGDHAEITVTPVGSNVTTMQHD